VYLRVSPCISVYLRHLPHVRACNAFGVTALQQALLTRARTSVRVCVCVCACACVCALARASSSALYLFPCQHALHMHCVEYYMLRHGGLSAADKQRVKQLKASLHAEDVKMQHAQGRARRTAPDALSNEASSASADYSRMQVLGD